MLGGHVIPADPVDTFAQDVWHDICSTLEVMPNMQLYSCQPFAQEIISMATSHDLTLLDVIQAVSEVAENDREIIATVVHLISSGQVRLGIEAIEAIRQLVSTVDTAA